MYQGRVYATTKEAANGKYKDKNGNILKFAYLYDTVLVDGYDTVHPNCRHRFSIFPPNAYTLDELAEFSRQSMQPFADTRSDSERKAYAEEQAVKRKRNASRRQYEEIKSYLPDEVPKTFAAWQRMKSTNSQRYQDLLEDYRTVKKTIANSEQSGIINFKDNNPYYKEITQKNIDNVPKLDVFDNNKLNLKYQQANKELLSKAMQYDTGTEVSIVYSTDMQPIKDHSYVIGNSGSVKIDNPNILYHAFHNHPSGNTLGIDDLMNFTRRERMLSLTASGNNGSIYIISRSLKNDSIGFRDFIKDRCKEKFFSIDDKMYSYQEIYKGEVNILSLSDKSRDNFAKDLNRFCIECAKGGSEFGFKYISKKVT